MSSELAGWKALLAQQSDASTQLRQWQQLRENDTRKLNALTLPALTLSPQEVTDALAQHVQLRPLRQRLSNLHGQITPKQKTTGTVTRHACTASTRVDPAQRGTCRKTSAL